MTDSPPIRFVDSNIWLYALIESQDREKHVVANQLTRSSNLIVSTQVINEVCINLRKKAGFGEERLRNLISGFYQSCTVVEFRLPFLLNASKLRENYAFSFWDSLIVASALSANATQLISEDMQNGLLIENRLEIRNPFL